MSINLPEWAFKNASYYIGIADFVRKNRIRCHSRQIGCVLVKDDTLISTGFNGPPRKIPTCDEWPGNYGNKLMDKFFEKFPEEFDDDGHINLNEFNDWVESKCPRKLLEIPSGEGLEYCSAVHAERNALLSCAKTGVSSNGGIMFMTCGLPCKDCMIEIIQAGVSGIICGDIIIYDNYSWKLAKESNMTVYSLYNKEWYKLIENEFVKIL